jgi:hypothetical protein
MTVLNEIEKLVQRVLKYLILLYDTYLFMTITEKNSVIDMEEEILHKFYVKTCLE